ncbi:MAG: ribosome recycling factor [Candidatus Kerfeldbacteria bacterium]|nr:ribosome recycling factor [Candidatus Kerfeldbacteria bacterium]
MTDHLTTSIEQAISHLEHELLGIRTGRANPAMIEDIPVEAYGTKTPLVQLAAIIAPEPRLLVVQPWDPSVIKDIEKALTQSSLGITPVADGKLLRLPFPAMTEERRKDLMKVVNEKAEQTKVRLRGVREEEMKKLKTQERDGAISEDASTVAGKAVQTAIDQGTERIDTLVKAKTEEIMTV